MSGSVGPPPGWLDDPGDTYAQRYWDGSRYTEWVVKAGGEVARDGDDGSPPPPPVGPPLGPDGTAEVDRPPRQQPAVTRRNAPHAGDAVLSLISKVTLQSWLSDRIARGMWLPEVMDLARQRPSDPRALMMLGLRMRDFERVRTRVNRSGPPMSVAGAVLRPVLRPVMRAAAGAISSSDGIPGSTKVLGRAWELLEQGLRRRPGDPALLALMARNYLSGAEPEKAWEVAAAATRSQPDRGEPYYILAEASFQSGDHAGAQNWARAGAERGCTLALSLTRSDAPFRRNAWLTDKPSMAIPTADDYWRAFANYYEGATAAELYYHYGPQPSIGDQR